MAAKAGSLAAMTAANACALALTQTDEIHEILDLDDPLYRKRRDLIDELLGDRVH